MSRLSAHHLRKPGWPTIYGGVPTIPRISGSRLRQAEPVLVPDWQNRSMVNGSALQDRAPNSQKRIRGSNSVCGLGLHRRRGRGRTQCLAQGFAALRLFALLGVENRLAHPDRLSASPRPVHRLRSTPSPAPATSCAAHRASRRYPWWMTGDWSGSCAWSDCTADHRGGNSRPRSDRHRLVRSARRR